MNDDIKSIITCDLDGKIETFSEGAQELFGYTADEIIDKGSCLLYTSPSPRDS